MPRYIWSAEGCPAYPASINALLEAALANNEPEVEFKLRGREYIVRLGAQRPFKQFLKADRTKSRVVERELAPPTFGERMLQGLAALRVSCFKDPLCVRWMCLATRLRRHAILLLVNVILSWVGVTAMALLRAHSTPGLLQAYINSLAFWACFVQAILASTCTRFAICALWWASSS